VAATASVSAVALAIAVILDIGSRSAAYVRNRHVLTSAADTGLELALADLSGPGWTGRLDAGPASFFEGTASPTLNGWGTLDIVSRTRDLQRTLDARNPWADNGPRLIARGGAFVDEVVGGPSSAFRVYLMTWVADDPADGDADPARDSNGVIDVRVEAYASPASRIVLLATVRRHPHGVEVISWRED
jgi:hypothetical protein